MAGYEILVSTPIGTPKGAIDQLFRCSYARTVNNIGEMNISIPDIYPSDWFQRDTRIYVQRSVGSNIPSLDLETCWFVQDWTTSLSLEGKATLDLRCVDTIAILSYYIVPYNANNSSIPGSLKQQEADNMMKAIVRENMGSLASDTTRNLGSYLSVAADTTSAPVVRKEFSKRVVLDVLRELADSSLKAGTYLAFDIVVTDITAGTLQFRTYTTQRGNDHRNPGGNPPLILDVDTDTLANVSLAEKHTNEKTYVYASGSGVADVRPTGVAFDQARIDASPFGRRELFIDDNSTTEVVTLEADADAALMKNRPIVEFTSQLNDQATVVRGVHWDYGDYMTANYKTRTFDVHADKIAVTLNEDGSDKTDVALKSES